MRKFILMAAAAAVLASTPAFAAPPSVCIRQDDLYNWTALNDKHVVIENYQHKKALLTLIGVCTGLKFHETIAIRSPGGTGLSCISPGDTLSVRDLGMNQRCAIIKVEPYTAPAATPAAGQSSANTGAGH